MDFYSAKPPVETPVQSWYCVRTQPKREMLARLNLGALPEVEAYLPRIKTTRKRRDQTRYTVCEPVFPGYIFVRFPFATHARLVTYAQGVAYLIRKGDYVATIADDVIQGLRSLVNNEEVIEIMPPLPGEGEEVTLIHGIFRGVRGRVVAIIPSKERIRVLMDILGQERPVELSWDEVDRAVRPTAYLR
jgi:transcriptional antiterminator RfaH